MDDSKPILFYDIASGPPVRSFAPNPWKTRYALNFKGAHYQTEWVELLEVESVRKQLGAPPNRTFPDGSPFYTLPVIKNTSTGEIVGDSFDIALYLDKIFPDAPKLFQPSTVGLLRAFNVQVDAVFTNHILLCMENMPLNPDTAEEYRTKSVARYGISDWRSTIPHGEEKAKLLASFQTALGDLAKAYKDSDGPFLERNTPSYADIIVGAWLQTVRESAKEWDEIKTWHDGRWGKIHDALEQYATIK